MSQIRSILFTCSLNAVRSPMAEGLARHLLGRTAYVDSAGVGRAELDGFALSVMRELDIDIADHNTQTLDDIDPEGFDTIVALSPEAHARALEVTRATAVTVLYWPINDPTGTGQNREQKLSAYRATRDDIRQRISATFCREAAQS
jgi:protein-tyrosine-phosphatase